MSIDIMDTICTCNLSEYLLYSLYLIRNTMIITVLNVLQVILAVLMIVVILMQQNSAGLGAAFGGAGGVEMTRRGADKFLYNATVALAIVFFSISLAIVII